jgi:hypothetical protein
MGLNTGALSHPLNGKAYLSLPAIVEMHRMTNGAFDLVDLLPLVRGGKEFAAVLSQPSTKRKAKPGVRVEAV